MLFVIVAGLLCVVKTNGIPSYQFAVDEHLSKLRQGTI